MYPRHELERLASRKQVLLRRIARRRQECAVLAGTVAETLRRIDTLREKVTHWTGFASAFLPFFFRARAELGKPRPEGRLARAFHWASVGLKLAKGPLTYVFRVG